MQPAPDERFAGPDERLDDRTLQLQQRAEQLRRIETSGQYLARYALLLQEGRPTSAGTYAALLLNHVGEVNHAMKKLEALSYE